MLKKPRQFLDDLLNAHSPSGFEARCARVWLDYLQPIADEVLTDAYGNAFAVLNPKGSPVVMFEGHSDEIGLMVTYIDEEGYLWVSQIGGVDPKMLPGKRVILHTPEGPLNGVIGAMAPHMQDPKTREQSAKMTDIYIDIGAANKKEAVKLVTVGTPATIDHGPVALLGDTLAARSCDNKIGVWSAAEGLRRYKELKKGQACIIAAAHIQEEVGLVGAGMGAFRWNPDVALVVDVTNAVDYPDTDPKLRNKIKMGEGPALRIGPACHPVVMERLEKVAKTLKINLQRVPIPGRSGTNANAIYPARQGIPTGILSTPNRYMHSPSETINLKDLDQIPTLMARFAADLKKGEKFTVHRGGRK
ncbi:M20/M25/M40 family metallo-hydrolase [bacterium]|nr:M20/M25/M40 family metallo-hydrolase [bacterium]